MRVSLAWLKEFVAVTEAPRALGHRLTMAGLELEAFELVAPAFKRVVVARIVACEKHPDADKLSVCRVDAGDGQLHQVVCGAPNARAGLVAPFALPGATIGDKTIKVGKLRGVESQGMLCSARELGLGEDQDGLLELPSDLVLGTPLEQALALDDAVLELAITPNRGDCQSMLGVAREVAVLIDKPLCTPVVAPVVATSTARLSVTVEAPADCPVFAGRLVQGIRTDARSPLWLTERLRRAGLRAIHPVVDVTNYVMLELGQPMHGYDAATLAGGIVVRRAKRGERLTLLDGNEVTLDPEVLVIADAQRLRGIAGVMGGADSGVSATTTDVFLESAWFTPSVVAGRARRFGMHTDAAARFERGVDPTGQVRAVERATALLLEIVGGTPGPVVELRATTPTRTPVRLRTTMLATRLGIEVPAARVGAILNGLGFTVKEVQGGWDAVPPAWRFDVTREEDLIEEVGRVHGYEAIPPAHGVGKVLPLAETESRVGLRRLCDALVDRGYDEAITYSFVSPEFQSALFGEGSRPKLRNPIAADMAELRASLLPGLLTALQYNLARQQDRVRLFECGVRFSSQPNEITEENVIASLAYGDVAPVQWGVPARAADFADMRGDLEALLTVAGVIDQVRLVPAVHPALHPGQSARVELGGAPIGWIGALHPRLLQTLSLVKTPVFFEVSMAALVRRLPAGRFPPKFPSVRRDLAVIVEEEVSAEALLETVKVAAGTVLASVEVFDVYRGKGIDSGRKSIAMTLILLDSSRTLTDEDTDSVITRVAGELASRLGAVLRE